MSSISLFYQSSTKLLSYMKRTNFTVLGEDVRVDENGDPIASYDLMNWHTAKDGSLQLVRVGFYDASLREDRDLVINESVIVWHRGNKVCTFSSLAKFVLHATGSNSITLNVFYSLSQS